MKDTIDSIIDCWINFLNDGDIDYNNIYSFIPLSYSSFSKDDFYIVDTRPFIKNDFVEHYENCCFIKKEDIKYALTDEFCFIRYNKETANTANLLWSNHNDTYGYYCAWLYSLSGYIINNKNNISLCLDNQFFNCIRNIFDYFQISSDSMCLEFRDTLKYSAHSVILPDGLLKTDFYKVSDLEDITVQVSKILLSEMLYILNTNYLIVY